MRLSRATKPTQSSALTVPLLPGLLLLACVVATLMYYGPFHRAIQADTRPKVIRNNVDRKGKVVIAATGTEDADAPSHILPVGERDSRISQTVASDIAQLLKSHPIHKLSNHERSSMSLEDHFVFLHNQEVCSDIPIFTSMANVFSDMYWQLIENFIYTMAKFNVSSCTLMVCVSDPRCMQLCAASHFPCVDFQYSHFHPGAPLPSALEQIGELKLLHLPKAINKGVDILMLDLDVGFIGDPMTIVHRLDHSKSDIFVQKDITYVMNRSREGWRTWYTEPQPNIGIMLCRGNKKVVKMFNLAWREYEAIDKPIKHNPGKDQNKVVFAMRVSRRNGLRWEYIPEEAAVLLDKIYKFDLITTFELGGEAAQQVLDAKGADAVHTTCYEQKTKVMGLKAANAFWNPLYYNPLRRTITKQLVFLNEQQLRWEVRSLIYLAIATNRSLIIPNVLGNEQNEDVQLFDQQALWPGFRVAFFKKGFPYAVDLLEPAFYWRVRRDYIKEAERVPVPTVVSVQGIRTINGVEKMLLSEEWRDVPRLVLYAPASSMGFNNKSRMIDAETLRRVVRWAEDSVSRFEGSYAVESRRYGRLPNLGEDRKGTKTALLTLPKVADRIVTDVRLCSSFMNPNMGNRSCFDKCK